MSMETHDERKGGERVIKKKMCSGLKPPFADSQLNYYFLFFPTHFSPTHTLLSSLSLERNVSYV